MIYTTLNFNAGQLNASTQVGDYIYYVGTPSQEGGFNITDNTDGYSSITYFGEIAAIQHDVDEGKFAVVVEHEDSVAAPTVGNFILFAKDDNANTSSLSGYYGSFTFKNNSKVKAELFATTCNITESSK